jgi:hypothetical protein
VLCVSAQLTGSPTNTAQGKSALNFVATIDGVQS